eukprot:m.166650 g.166650  ORF g.166650 m.166650 type:complete len:547 (-) comp12721_c0_seq1:290-1930(-)
MSGEAPDAAGPAPPPTGKSGKGVYRSTRSRKTPPKGSKRQGSDSRRDHSHAPKRARTNEQTDTDEGEGASEAGPAGPSEIEFRGVGADGSEPQLALEPRLRYPDEAAIASRLTRSLELDVLKAKVGRLDVMMADTYRQMEAIRDESEHNMGAGDGSAVAKPAKSDNIVRINVGGTIFATRKATLAKFDGTYTAALASGRFDDERDSDGCIFIDRDPKYFAQILNFLRDPAAPQEWDIEDPGLIHELTFFGLKELIHKGSLYVAYGFDGSGRLNTIESYNPHFRTWKEVAQFKSELSSPACAVLNGKMYITGGKNSKNRAVATAAFYDPIRKDITVTTDLQIPRFGHGLVELDGYIYAVGGYGDDGGRVDSVERYDEDSKSWTSMPGLHDVRSALGCDALRGKIYVAGGYGPGTQPQSLVDMVEVFDPKTSHWEKAASLNIPRAHVCCVTYKDKLWAVGGYDGQHASQTVEIYDPVTKRWTEGPKLIKKRSVVVCAVLDDQLYAIGGYDGQSYLKCSEVYDPDAKRWLPGPDMTVSRGRHCVCTLPI